MAHDVFISYSSKDKPTADAVCALLERQNVRCWIAPRDVLPGEEWAGAIIDAIAGAKVFVLIFSGSANASAQVKREVERAANHELPIIPFRIENVAPNRSLEFFISTPHWLDAYSPPLDDHISRLASVINQLVAKHPSQSADPHAAAVPPDRAPAAASVGSSATVAPATSAPDAATPPAAGPPARGAAPRAAGQQPPGPAAATPAKTPGMPVWGWVIIALAGLFTLSLIISAMSHHPSNTTDSSDLALADSAAASDNAASNTATSEAPAPTREGDPSDWARANVVGRWTEEAKNDCINSVHTITIDGDTLHFIFSGTTGSDETIESISVNGEIDTRFASGTTGYAYMLDDDARVLTITTRSTGATTRLIRCSSE